MDWNELLPDDKRTLKALLNLDDDGLPLAPAKTNTDTSRDVAHQPPRSVETTVSLSQLKEGMNIEITKALPHWAVWRDAHRMTKKKPQVRSSTLTVREIMNGIVFQDFMVVTAETAVELKQPPSTWRLRTMHFAHRIDPDLGNEVQSVWVPERPLYIQCVARDILRFSLVMLFRAQYNGGAVPRQRGGALIGEWDPKLLTLPTSGNVVILGMGGNVMGNCLVHLLPCTVSIHAVEVEPSVVAVCTMEGLIPQVPNFHVHVKDMVDALEGLEDNSCPLIILDCFDPIATTMLHGIHILQLARRKLTSPSAGSSGGGGVLIVNTHVGATPGKLEPFCHVFDAATASVEVINIFGLNQSIVACTASPLQEIGCSALTLLVQAINARRETLWSGGEPAAQEFHIDEDFADGVKTVNRTKRNADGTIQSAVRYRLWDAADDTK